MRKNKNYLFVLLFICVLATLSDKIVYAQEKCNVDIFKNIVVQKGKKVKLYSNTYCKIKWKSSSRKVKINKKGMLKAKKKGKVKILGKTEDGNRINVKVIIKKKIVKASNKTVQLDCKQKSGEESFQFWVKNNSDQCVNIVWTGGLLKQKINGNILAVPQKQILNNAFPFIYLEPGKIFSCSGVSINNYELNDGTTYVLDFDVTPGYKLSNSAGKFHVQGEFVYKSH